jgi:hypothetical protein
MSLFGLWKTSGVGKGAETPPDAVLNPTGLMEETIAANLALGGPESPLQASETRLSVIRACEPAETPLRLSEAELFRLCELYGRAVLVEICKSPKKFGLEGENIPLDVLYREACALQAQFWEALELANGDLGEVTDPTAPVWRTAAELTQLDWKARKGETDGSV